MCAHAIFSTQFFSQPTACRNTREAETVGVFSQHRLRPYGIEAWLEVLDKIQLALSTLEGAHHVGRIPARGYCKLTGRQAISAHINLRLQREKVLADIVTRLLGALMLVRLDDHDARRVTHLLQVPNGAKNVQVPP